MNLRTGRRERTSHTEGGYEDAFEKPLLPADSRSAEELVRSGLEGVPWLVRSLIPVIHRRVLLLRLGPLRAPDHVLGWRILSSEPDRVVLRAESPLFLATLTGWRTDDVVGLRTELRYRRPASARLVWSCVGPLHRGVAPFLLSRAARAYVPTA